MNKKIQLLIYQQKTDRSQKIQEEIENVNEMTRKTENFHSKIEQHLEEDESDEPQGWLQIRLIFKAKVFFLLVFELLNDAFLIIQNWLVDRVLQISFIFSISLKNIIQNFVIFLWKFAIKIFVKINFL